MEADAEGTRRTGGKVVLTFSVVVVVGMLGEEGKGCCGVGEEGGD